ncbi:MAG: SapC family protein, partial [Hyphomonas sp.]
VDLDNPRVGAANGLPLFLQHGGNSPYLQHVSHVLKVINRGTEIAGPMFAAFQEADLLEPALLDIRLDEHTGYKVPEVYSINADKLAALEGALLERLHKAGYLRAAYLALASLSNVSRLIELKNAKRAEVA